MKQQNAPKINFQGVSSFDDYSINSDYHTKTHKHSEKKLPFAHNQQKDFDLPIVFFQKPAKSNYWTEIAYDILRSVHSEKSFTKTSSLSLKKTNIHNISEEKNSFSPLLSEIGYQEKLKKLTEQSERNLGKIVNFENNLKVEEKTSKNDQKSLSNNINSSGKKILFKKSEDFHQKNPRKLSIEIKQKCINTNLDHEDDDELEISKIIGRNFRDYIRRNSCYGKNFGFLSNFEKKANKLKLKFKTHLERKKDFLLIQLDNSAASRQSIRSFKKEYSPHHWKNSKVVPFKTVKLNSRKSFSSLESEKIPEIKHECKSNRHLGDSIMPNNNTKTFSIILRSEKKAFSYVLSDKTPKAFKKPMKKIPNLPLNLKKMTSQSQENDQISKKTHFKSETSRHLPSLSLGERLISESFSQKNMKSIDNRSSMKSTVTFRDEYQILGSNTERYLPNMTPRLSKTKILREKLGEVYRKSNKSCHFTLKKLRKNL